MQITLSPDSPLRRIPARSDRKQTLFLDGMRHSVEMASLAFDRLTSELTDVALHLGNGGTSEGDYTSPLLHAWGVVDALDRFRGLFRTMPGNQVKPPADGRPGFLEKTEVIRSIRNVGDHLHGRIDQIVAKEFPAMGKLAWITLLDGTPQRFLSCVIVPGTVGTGSSQIPLPANYERLEGPTDAITLHAGEFSADLSKAMRDLARLLNSFEKALAAAFAGEPSNGHLGSDLAIAVLLEEVDDPGAAAPNERLHQSARPAS